MEFRCSITAPEPIGCMSYLSAEPLTCLTIRLVSGKLPVLFVA